LYALTKLRGGRLGCCQAIALALHHGGRRLVGEPGIAQPGHAPRQGTVRVADARGALEERKVELGVSNRVQAQVLSGLAEGERVVSGLVVGNGAGRPQMTPRL